MEHTYCLMCLLALVSYSGYAVGAGTPVPSTNASVLDTSVPTVHKSKSCEFFLDVDRLLHYTKRLHTRMRRVQARLSPKQEYYTKVRCAESGNNTLKKVLQDAEEYRRNVSVRAREVLRKTNESYLTVLSAWRAVDEWHVYDSSACGNAHRNESFSVERGAPTSFIRAFNATQKEYMEHPWSMINNGIFSHLPATLSKLESLGTMVSEAEASADSFDEALGKAKDIVGKLVAIREKRAACEMGSFYSQLGVTFAALKKVASKVEEATHEVGSRGSTLSSGGHRKSTSAAADDSKIARGNAVMAVRIAQEALNETSSSVMEITMGRFNDFVDNAFCEEFRRCMSNIMANPNSSTKAVMRSIHENITHLEKWKKSTGDVWKGAAIRVNRALNISGAPNSVVLYFLGARFNAQVARIKKKLFEASSALKASVEKLQDAQDGVDAKKQTAAANDTKKHKVPLNADDSGDVVSRVKNATEPQNTTNAKSVKNKGSSASSRSNAVHHKIKASIALDAKDEEDGQLEVASMLGVAANVTVGTKRIRAATVRPQHFIMPFLATLCVCVILVVAYRHARSQDEEEPLVYSLLDSDSLTGTVVDVSEFSDNDF
ncbi:hypothetical protein ERJ75_000162400 [Trypanosoma vivax]|nr:hypothetical protein ERJ75_000162400 [Trypanosoma vivax]